VAWLTEPLSYGFVVRGLVAGLLASVACAGLSAFVVWRGLAFAGDALAHSILPGIVVAYMLGFSLLLGALGAALIAVVGIGLIAGRGALREDTAIGVVFSGLFALGVLLLTRVATFQDLHQVLFGNILGVDSGDLIAMAVVVSVVIGAVVLFYKELLVTTFDASHAVAIGLSPQLVRYGLLGAVALTTVVAVQSVGVVLVLALLVTPGAAASLLSRRLNRIMVLAMLFSVLATVIGFYASYYLDLAAGPAIVLALTGLFLVSWLTARIGRRAAGWDSRFPARPRAYRGGANHRVR
jgi:ABC-type Mn2+/Zn2+ transport system permease subunit